MEPYARNPKCSCARCRAKDLMGSALIISTGVLLLLQSMDVVRVHQSWPVILLVVGAFSFLGHTASIEGHVPPYSVAAAPVVQPPWSGAEAAAGASPQTWSGSTSPATSTSTSSEQTSPNDQQVNP